jgi:hypothetical protein
MDSNSIPRSRCISASAQRSCVVSTKLGGLGEPIESILGLRRHPINLFSSSILQQHREAHVLEGCDDHAAMGVGIAGSVRPARARKGLAALTSPSSA